MRTGSEIATINVLGKEGAHKNMLIAVIAFNVKKYLKITKRKVFIRAAKEVRRLFKATNLIFIEFFSRSSFFLASKKISNDNLKNSLFNRITCATVTVVNIDDVL